MTLSSLFFLLFFSFFGCAKEVVVAPKTESSPSHESTKILPGKTMRDCLCTRLWMPVCGKNGKTYGNSCEAQCAGVEYTLGECGIKKKADY